jgi:hypothetical protein
MNIGNRFKVENDKIIKISNGEILTEDEPLFLLRARDHLALKALLFYADLCALEDCTDYQLDSLHEMLTEFHNYRLNNPDKMKQPGITRGK